ncbi:hypothetical protein [Pontibacter amylolyticus]|uniref:Uncharacterized protein n=1 Tax=Pontibacter amylolyticus TaxID=1424080 RepID=A0ABQ1W5P2_9BACT|nr:hypothetical protein [Pontibacter amylolyticus]GGG13408.1 hypothetical protein GCM10011323_17250 [Pontibacter amylolyticus]
MKKFALVLIMLLIGLIIYNLTNIDFSGSLTSVPNQQVYMRLVANVLVLLSLAYSYRRYSKRTEEKR